jgi:hypothetical protein
MSNVLRWVKNPDLSRMEELLVHIANLRMPTAAQLAALMGITKKSVVQNIYLLNKEEKHTIRSMKMRRADSEKVYWLGRRACQLVEETTGEKVEYYEFSRRKGQSRHTKGVNDILIRMIEKAGLDDMKKHCAFWNGKGAKQEVFQAWKLMEGWDEEQAAEEFKSMLSPDARFTIGGERSHWLEFDNATKEKGAIFCQFELYVVKLVPIGNRDSVIWVCKDDQRRDEMIRWWREFKAAPPSTPEMQAAVARVKGEGKKFYLPEMHFFSQGDETAPLLTGRF